MRGASIGRNLVNLAPNRARKLQNRKRVVQARCVGVVPRRKPFAHFLCLFNEFHIRTARTPVFFRGGWVATVRAHVWQNGPIETSVGSGPSNTNLDH